MKDTEQELNSEEEEDYEHEVIPVELDGIRYEEFASYRIGIFGDVGVGKSTLLQAFIQKKEPTNILATDGVNYEIYQRGKDGIAIASHSATFPDSFGYVPSCKVLLEGGDQKGYFNTINAAVFVIDATDPSTIKHILSFIRCSSFTEPLKDFFIPEIKKIHSPPFPTLFVLNKCDQPMVVTKHMVSHLAKESFVDALVCCSGCGKGRYASNSMFRELTETLRQNDK